MKLGSAGKSRMAAALASYVACFVEQKLAAGEVAKSRSPQLMAIMR